MQSMRQVQQPPQHWLALKLVKRRALQDRIDAKSGKTNPMLDAVKAFTPGFKDGGKVKGYRHGGKTSCNPKSKTRGMGAAMRGGNFSGVR